MPQPNANPSQLLVCWTTVAERSDADRLAREIIQRRLAACVQIDGPITSVYEWKGQVETGQEHRLWIKAPARCLEPLERFVSENHPYETPQWVCVAAEKVSEKYLKWADDVANLRGFS